MTYKTLRENSFNEAPVQIGSSGAPSPVSDSLNSRSISSAAPWSEPGMKCRYVRRILPSVQPRRSATTEMGTPAISIWLAAVCRRSCNRTRGTPAFLL